VDTQEIQTFLDNSDFSGVVLVRDGDRTIFEAARGFATPRWQVPNTLDTRFDTASITKLFTSVAVLQQVDAGRLDLEASIHEYVDLGGSAIGTDVTLLHLLTHTSGIADDVDEEAGEDYDAFWAQTPSYSLIETADFLPLFADKPRLAPPGVEVVDCNVGYILAGLAVERASGLGYRDYVREEVFARSGMTDSGFFDRRDAVERVAEGWDRRGDGSWVANIYSSPAIGSPDSGAHTTAGDLMNFLNAVRGGQLLSKEYTDEFFTPQVDYDDDVKYGFGLEFDLDDNGSVRSYYKDGVNAGASGILRHYPKSGLDVVVLSNAEEGAWDLVVEIDAQF
jgi:CubicO group peptidase (beta-lactamase class C family)